MLSMGGSDLPPRERRDTDGVVRRVAARRDHLDQTLLPARLRSDRHRLMPAPLLGELCSRCSLRLVWGVAAGGGGERGRGGGALGPDGLVVHLTSGESVSDRQRRSGLLPLDRRWTPCYPASVYRGRLTTKQIIITITTGLALLLAVGRGIIACQMKGGTSRGGHHPPCTLR